MISSLEPLDLAIVGTPDEVSQAAMLLIDKLEHHYGPMVANAESFLHDISTDPVSDGFTAFVANLGQLQNDRSRVSQWLIEATAEKRRSQTRVRRAKTAYEEKLHLTLAYDPDISAVDGQQAKMALARSKLHREFRIVAYAEQIYTQVLGFFEALKLAHDQINESKRDMMAQLAVIKQMVILGEISPEQFPAEREGVGSNLRETEHAIARELGEAGSGLLEL